MIKRLLCLLFGHHRAKYEWQAHYSDDEEFHYAFYRCERCKVLIWDDTEVVPRNPQMDIIHREDLDRCKSEHKEVSL